MPICGRSRRSAQHGICVLRRSLGSECPLREHRRIEHPPNVPCGIQTPWGLKPTALGTRASRGPAPSESPSYRPATDHDPAALPGGGSRHNGKLARSLVQYPAPLASMKKTMSRKRIFLITKKIIAPGPSLTCGDEIDSSTEPAFPGNATLAGGHCSFGIGVDRKRALE